MSVALIGPEEGRRWALAKALAETGRAKVREFHSYPAGRGDFQWLLEQSFDAIILDLDSDPDVALELVERVNASDAATIMVYSEKADTKLAGCFMRAGAREYLLLPLEQGIVEEALVRTAAILRPKAPSAEKALGKLLVFLGAKGGTGVTTIACNLAIALARESDQSTLLIDLAAPIGDVALALGIAADYSTADALGNADRLDTSFLQGLLVKHRSGVFVLAAPSEIPEVEASKDAIDKLITVARRKFDHVIVDVGSRIDAASTALFKKASTIYLVTQTGISELRNSNRFISQFFTEGDPTLEIVINRFEPRLLAGVHEDVVTKALGRPVRWKIPDDQDAAREKQCGETGLGTTRVSRLSLEMASSITGRPVPQEKKRGFGLKGFGRSTAKEVSGNDDLPGISIATPAYARATPTITWPTPDLITYGDTLTTGQLSATASVPGTFDYSPAPGEVLAAGTHTLCVTFTPRDSANYATAQATVPLKVAGATPVVAWTTPDPVPYGTPLDATQLSATASVPGTFDYSPAPGEVLAAGTHTLCVTFTPRDSANYATAQATVPLKVARATPVVAWTTPDPVPYGTPLDATQLSATASVPGTFDYSPAPGEVLAAGTHTLCVTFTPRDSANYATAQATVPLKVARATPVVAWTTPDPVPYGTPLDATQLSATASVPGTFDYSPAPGEVLAAGTHTLCVTFTPRDSANYATAQATVPLKVAGATPVVAWTTPDPVPYGTPLDATQLSATASVPGTFDYSPAPGEVLAAGTHTLCVTFTPRDSANYATAQATVPLKVARATPVVAWTTPDPVPYGTPLDATQLSATASVPGTFDYSPAPGEVLAAGTHTLCVTFTPRDSANYATAQATVPLKVARATPVVAWTTPDPVPYGTPLDATQLSATASVPGTFDYSPAPGEVLAAGTHTLCVTFTPRDSANYATAQATVPLKVARATPVVAWTTPDPVPYGTPLDATQLSATAWIRGTSVYSPAAGHILASEGLSDIALLPTGFQWRPSSRTITANDSALANSVPAEVTGKRSATETSPRETRMYKGAVYEKGEDGQWHLQQK